MSLAEYNEFAKEYLMQPLLYTDLTAWYDLLDPMVDHEGEAGVLRSLLEREAAGPLDTLLELGAGAGNNAYFLKSRFKCTLTDLSPAMQALSRRQNPECEHILGDMRALRLGHTFDAVVIHDAIMYMTSEAELLAAARTAAAHLRPGGVAVFAPDWSRETFAEATQLYEHAAGSRAMRTIEWSWDPDPSDSTATTEFAFLLRDGVDMRAVHDRHVCGLFSRETWRRVLTAAGFATVNQREPLDEEAVEGVFVCRT